MVTADPAGEGRFILAAPEHRFGGPDFTEAFAIAPFAYWFDFRGCDGVRPGAHRQGTARPRLAREETVFGLNDACVGVINAQGI